MKTVVCLDCKYLWQDSEGWGPRHCEHPMWIISDTCHPTNYNRREIVRDDIHEKPHLINVGCDCPYYKRKWWKFWRVK
jgi:hypothetical protein